jgi:hypothetical protein
LLPLPTPLSVNINTKYKRISSPKSSKIDLGNTPFPALHKRSTAKDRLFQFMPSGMVSEAK